jgi:FtsP/CotA-like multicopper oxidase with cupredoxin domain
MLRKPAPPVLPTRPPRTEPTGIVQVVRLEAMEHAWEVIPGIIVRGYGYNAHVPGPTLEATVGDTLLVRFTNSLPEPTSLCWHGLGLPAGNGDAVRASAVVPAGGTVEHRLELPDAGTFWYHPDVDHTPQTERGLYGALVVRDPVEPALDAERVLVFGGCEGSLLVNGVQEAQVLMTAGHRERWRTVNAGGAHLRLSLSGRPLTVISPHSGLLAATVEADEVLLGPGERRDLLTGPFTVGQSLALDALPCQHGNSPGARQRLARLHVVEPSGRDAP